MSIRTVIKNNKKLHAALLPIVQMERDFRAGPVSTSKFYIKHWLRRMGIMPLDPLLKQMEDKYAGKHKRVFIIATGPSLRMSDLNWLEENNEITMSVNGIYKIFDRTKWRPSYYVMDDYWVYKRWLDAGVHINFENNCKDKVFLSDDMMRGLEYQCDRNRVASVSLCYWDHWYNPESIHMKYCRDIKYGHYDMFTVTNLCINLADYMGFEKIYLLGVDCNYRSRNMHIGESAEEHDDKMLRNLIRVEDAQRKGYRLIEKERSGLVFNASRGGKLEEFSRVNMDDIISGKVNYSSEFNEN